MPYINQGGRAKFEDLLETFDLLSVGDMAAGELNYVISSIVHEWLIRHRVSYGTLNQAIGVLECAKLELYKQVVAPYEEKKKAENGPVSGLDDGGHYSGQ